MSVLNAIEMVPEVCRVFCATANPVQVVVAVTEQGRGALSPPRAARARPAAA